MPASDAPKSPAYGLMAEFRDAESLLAAASRAYEAGYRRIDAFSPMPVHGLAEAMGYRDRWVQLAVLAMGLVGMAGGFSLAYYTSVIELPFHPVFNVQRFREHATQDGFFLCIEAADAKFDAEQTGRFLAGLGAVEVNDVAH